MKNIDFDIFTSRWHIEYVDYIEPEADEMWRCGECNPMTRTISIATKDFDGKPVSKRDLTVTLFHELMHAIFTEGYWDEEYNDERLVEWCGKCLTFLKEQKVI